MTVEFSLDTASSLQADTKVSSGARAGGTLEQSVSGPPRSFARFTSLGSAMLLQVSLCPGHGRERFLFRVFLLFVRRFL